MNKQIQPLKSYHFVLLAKHLSTSKYGLSKYKGKASIFYIAFIAATIITLVCTGVLVGIAAAFGSSSLFDILKKNMVNIPSVDVSIIAITFGIYSLLIISFIIGSAFYKIFILNNVISTIYCGQSQLKCSLDFIKYTFIFLTNINTIFLSLGLAIPWSRIRYNKYFYSSISIALKDNLDEIVSMDDKDIKSFAEEFYIFSRTASPSFAFVLGLKAPIFSSKD